MADQSRRRSPRKRSDVDSRKRALAIIAAFLWERARFANKDWAAAWAEVEAGGPFDSKVVENLRQDPELLTRGEWASIELVLRYLVARPPAFCALAAEVDILGPIIAKAGLGGAFLPGVKDHRVPDRQLMEALQLDDWHADPEQMKALLNTVGGLWHVIQTDGSAVWEFSVSLLSIKPLKYLTRGPKGSLAVVLSLLPHFSLRTPSKDGQIQVFRGVVIKIDSTLYFFAIRDQKPAAAHLLLMSWTMPGQDPRHLSPKVTQATGVVMSVDGEGNQIATPTAAQLVEVDFQVDLRGRREAPTDIRGRPSPPSAFADALVRGEKAEPSQQDLDQVEFWEERLRRGIARVGGYDQRQLFGELEPLSAPPILHEVLKVLSDRQESGKKGFFKS